MKCSIRDLLVSVIVAVLSVWLVERGRLAKEIRRLTPQHSDSGGVLISSLALQGGITRLLQFAEASRFGHRILPVDNVKGKCQSALAPVGEDSQVRP